MCQVLFKDLQDLSSSGAPLFSYLLEETNYYSKIARVIKKKKICPNKCLGGLLVP